MQISTAHGRKAKKSGSGVAQEKRNEPDVDETGETQGRKRRGHTVLNTRQQNCSHLHKTMLLETEKKNTHTHIVRAQLSAGG